MSTLPIPGDLFSDPFRRPVLYNPRQNIWCYIDVHGAYHVIGAPAVPTIPPDANAYPFKMPTVEPGSPIVVGTGPDEIQLRLSGNPDSSAAGMNVFDLIADGVLIANDFVVSSFAGQDQGQYFTFRGTWGMKPHTLTLQPALSGPGMKDCWVTAVVYNSQPCYYNGINPNARNNTNQQLVNAVNVWDNTGIALAFTTTKAAEMPIPPPVPVPTLTLTLINGALRDGKPAEVATLAGLLERTNAGSVLQLPPGRIVGTSAIGAVTLKGAGKGQTIIDATGLPVAFGKAVLVPTVSGAVIEDMTITGAAGPDNNAAAVRQQGDGIDFTLNRVEVFGCQDGLLCFPGNVTVDGCDFHNNGAGDSFSHEVYLSGNAASVATVIDTTIVCGRGATHALKSRCGTTIIIGSSLTGSSDTTGAIGGSVLDVPDSGAVKISDTSIIMGIGAAQRELIGYGLESAKNGAGTVELQRVKVSISGESGYIKAAQAGAKLIIGDGCTYTGTVAPTIQGWDSVTGAFKTA